MSTDSGINSTFSDNFAKTDSANSAWVIKFFVRGLIGQLCYYF